MPERDVPIALLREVFEMVLARWPDEILPGRKTFHLGGGCNMRGLNAVHEPIEDWANNTDFPEEEVDGLISHVEHYLFTSIHSALRDVTRLSKADIDFNAFASRLDGNPSLRVIFDGD